VFHRSGKFLRELAEQMVLTQLQLARKGYWTGGNAPYGFARALVNERGEILEELPRGKRVHQVGHHMVLIPKDMTKIETWKYILTLKEQGWGYKAIVRHLNEAGIPSPDAGRIRTDHGVPHEVSERWSVSTVRELCTKRRVRRLAGGILAFGDTPFPDNRSQDHSDPTGQHRPQGANLPQQKTCKAPRHADSKKTASAGKSLPTEASVSERRPQEGVSFTKGSRGDRI
jgi:hypothetical protein